MNPIVYTGANDRYSKIAGYTWPRMERWCEHHGYTFAPKNFIPNLLHPSWQKLRVVTEYQVPTRTIIWMDADIFVLDMERDIEAVFPDTGIAFSSDDNGLCAGFFIFRGQRALDFLNLVKFLGPKRQEPYANSFHEQDSIKHLVWTYPSVQPFVRLLGSDIVCNPDTKRMDSFAYHGWANNWADIPAKLAEVKAEFGL